MTSSTFAQIGCPKPSNSSPFVAPVPIATLPLPNFACEYQLCLVAVSALPPTTVAQ
jgi:hypothetical protein